MPVFTIKPPEVKKQPSVAQPTLDRNADGTVSEKQVEEAPTESDLDELKSLGGNTKLKETKIVVNGPLSKVFAEALNKVLAYESLITNIAANNEEEEANLLDHNGDSIYVYAMDQDNLDYDGGAASALDGLTLALDSKTKRFLYMESNDRPSKKLDMVLNWCSESNITVICKTVRNKDRMKIASETIVSSFVTRKG